MEIVLRWECFEQCHSHLGFFWDEQALKGAEHCSWDNTLHFYQYLSTHVLLADRQFPLLIDVPIQNRAQQFQLYSIFSLPVTHSNLSAEYKVNYKYIGVTLDETRTVVITDLQYRACQHANGQFCRIYAPFQPLANPPSYVATLYAKNYQAIEEQCFFSNISYAKFIHTYGCYLKSLDHSLKPPDPKIKNDSNVPRQGQ